MASARRTPAGFTTTNSILLEGHGLKGQAVNVSLDGDKLVLAGEDGGTLAIPAARVDRMRLFRMEAVHSLHFNSPCMFELKIWWDGQRKPALLMPVERPQGFRPAVRGFAEAVAAAGGLKRLRLGPGYTTAIINLLIVGPPCLMLFAFMLWISVTDGGWWWLATAAAFALFVWLAGRNIVSRWPRPVRSLDQLDEELEVR